jgi:hypothetical protein
VLLGIFKRLAINPSVCEGNLMVAMFSILMPIKDKVNSICNRRAQIQGDGHIDAAVPHYRATTFRYELPGNAGKIEVKFQRTQGTRVEILEALRRLLKQLESEDV